MVKKMKFFSLLKNTDSSSSSSWAWPSCHQPRTLSFRVDNNNNNKNDVVSKTINSATAKKEILETSESARFSTVSSDDGVDPIETVIRGLRSDRLFFEPEETSSILVEANNKEEDASDSSGSFLKSGVEMVTMDSRDPYVDFRKSMEEMVEANGIVNDWEGLEELLCWYLKVNVKSNHGYIVNAFVDLVAERRRLAFSAAVPNSPSSLSSSPSTSPLSFCTSNSTTLPSSCSTPFLSCLDETRSLPPPSPLLLERVKGKEIIRREDDASSSSSTARFHAN